MGKLLPTPHNLLMHLIIISSIMDLATKIYWKLVTTLIIFKKKKTVYSFFQKDTDKKEMPKMTLQLNNEKTIGFVCIPVSILSDTFSHIIDLFSK